MAIRSFGDFAKLFATLAFLVLAAVHMAWPKILDETALVLVVLGAVPWLVPFIQTNVAGIDALGVKVDFVQHDLTRQSKRIDDLYVFAMGGKVFAHLFKLNRTQGYLDCYIGTAIPRELEYLENLGMIVFKKPLGGLDDFLTQFNFKNVDNLSDHVELTDTGKLFCALRDEAEKAKVTR